MNILSLTGSIIVTLALTSYSIGIISEQMKHIINPKVIGFVTVGLLLDITATIFMILGSPNSPFTFHGFIGYSALLAMLIDTSLMWRFYRRNTHDTKVPRGLHLYSRFAYAWWVLAYITGGLLVALK